MKRPSISRLSLAGSGDSLTISGPLLRRYSELLSEHGYIHVTDVPDGFEYENFLATFGEPFPGPFGRIVDDIVPEQGMDDVYYAGNRRALLPHTEGYEYEGLPPRYLSLWCVNPPDDDEGGETTLLDAEPLFSRLPHETEKRLSETQYAWHASAGLTRLGHDRRAVHAVLETVDGLRLFRFSSNNMVVPDGDPVADVLAGMQQTFDAECVSVDYRRNDFVHWDNWRVLHSRNAFQGGSRHLKRMMIGYRAERSPR